MVSVFLVSVEKGIGVGNGKPLQTILAWKVPQTEESGELPSMGSQKVGCHWANFSREGHVLGLLSLCNLVHFVKSIIFLLPLLFTPQQEPPSFLHFYQWFPLPDWESSLLLCMNNEALCIWHEPQEKEKLRCPPAQNGPFMGCQGEERREKFFSFLIVKHFLFPNSGDRDRWWLLPETVDHLGGGSGSGRKWQQAPVPREGLPDQAARAWPEEAGRAHLQGVCIRQRRGPQRWDLLQYRGREWWWEVLHWP